MNAFLHSIRGHPTCYPPRSEQNKLVSEEYRSVLHFQGRISVVLIFKERGSCSQAERSDGQTHSYSGVELLLQVWSALEGDEVDIEN